MSERRSGLRFPMLRGATILSAKGEHLSDCSIRDFSFSGVRLRVQSTIGIPHVFKLCRDADDTQQTCRLVWSSEREIGATFDD